MCNCIFVGVTAKKNLITAFLKICSFLAKGLVRCNMYTICKAIAFSTSRQITRPIITEPVVNGLVEYLEVGTYHKFIYLFYRFNFVRTLLMMGVNVCDYSKVDKKIT